MEVQRGPAQVTWSIMQLAINTLRVKTMNLLERGTRWSGKPDRILTTFLLFVNEILKPHVITSFERNPQNVEFLHNLAVRLSAGGSSSLLEL